MKLSIALGAVAGLIFMGGAIASAHPEEDEPGWNCQVDGNAICGPSDDQPEDPTVCYWDGSKWLSAYSQTYGEPCKFGNIS